MPVTKHHQATLSSLLILLFAALLTSPAPAQPADGTAPAPELLTVPDPGLDRLEPRVRQQLLDQRAQLDELLGDNDAEAGERAEAFGELGRLYHFYDLVGSALACFTNAETLDGTDYRWPYYLGTLEEAEGRFDTALDAYERSHALQSDQLATVMRLGDLHLKMRRFDEAATWFEHALDIRPQAAAALYGQGRIAAERDDVERAIELLEAALAEQPAANAVYHPLGLAYRDAGNLDKAKEALQKAGREPVSFSDPLVRSLAQLAKGARVHQILGDRARRKGLLPVAVDQYRQSLAIDPENALVHYNLGTVLAAVGEDDEAVDRYRDAVRLDPQLKNAHFNLGVALRARGDLPTSAGHFHRAVEIDPDDDEARLQLALTQLALGDADKALAGLEDLRERRPNAIGVVLPIARVLVAKGEFQRAETELKQLIASAEATDGLRAMAHLRLSGIEQQRGSEDGVRAALQKALELQPNLAEAHTLLGDSYGRTREYNPAGRSYTRAIELDPRDERAYRGVALVLVLTSRPVEAVSALEDGLTEIPTSMQLADFLARLLAASTDPGVRNGPRALEIAQALFEVERGPVFGETVGMALAAAGRFEDALPWQRRLLAESEQAGLPEAFLSRLRANLERYESGLIALQPW